MRIKNFLSISLVCIEVMGEVKAQTCSTTVSGFPYIENFEGSNALNWTNGGTNASWMLGNPAKSVIHPAAGTNARITNLNGNYKQTKNQSLKALALT
jgi:hypothetical protein